MGFDWQSPDRTSFSGGLFLIPVCREGAEGILCIRMLDPKKLANWEPMQSDLSLLQELAGAASPRSVSVYPYPKGLLPGARYLVRVLINARILSAIPVLTSGLRFPSRILSWAGSTVTEGGTSFCTSHPAMSRSHPCPAADPLEWTGSKTRGACSPHFFAARCQGSGTGKHIL